MNRSCKRYRRALKKNLLCRGRERKLLLTQFDEMLSQVLEDTSEPDDETLCSAMGKPEELAADLMKELPVESHSSWQRRRKIRIIASYLVAVILVASCGVLLWKVTHREVITSYEATFVGYPDESEEEYKEREREFFDKWDEVLENTK